MASKLNRLSRVIRLLWIPFLFTANVHAQIQTVWQIGLDEDPLQSGYNPTDEFAVENYVNDRAPGKVTRLPGDPLFNAGANPTADDDFYFAGSYPVGFNSLTN